MTTLTDEVVEIGEEKNNFIFARHETFHPRFGWIKKGFDSVLDNPTLFSQEDAHIHLGVGKNMGHAIKYWCLALKVLKQEPKSKSNDIIASDFGNKLLGKEGYDPFLEDTASLWLLHWNLLKNPCYATAWHVVFNQFRHVEFSSEDLFEELSEYRNNNASRISDSSLSKDISCILRMYCKSNTVGEFSEETLDCPFTDLGLIQQIRNTKHYRFNIGSKPNLPAEIVVAACLEFVGLKDNNQRTISIHNLLHQPSSPGASFKITESVIQNSIEQIGQYFNNITLSDTAGIVQLSFAEDPNKLSKQILDLYYNKKRG